MIYALCLWSTAITLYLWKMHGIHVHNATLLRPIIRAVKRLTEAKS